MLQQFFPFKILLQLTILLLAIASFSFQIKGKKKKRKAAKTTATQALPFGAWMHSHEEDEDRDSEWKTYRKSGFDFPPARGRSGFVLLNDHKIGLIRPSANDGRDTLWGTWTDTKSKGALTLSFTKTSISHFEATVKSKDIWQVKMN